MSVRTSCFMEISLIEAHLKALDSPQRFKAITELKNHPAEIAVPLLLTVVGSPEFLIRSLVAIGLGKHLTADSFATLLEMLKFDRDPHVRAEAVNSLSMFGAVGAPHLNKAFLQDDNWLVRHSIISALMDLNCPEELFEVCVHGVMGEDPTVQEAALKGLSVLAETKKEEAAKKELLSRVQDPQSHIRYCVAMALTKFEGEEVSLALSQLSKDEDHRVVRAVLEQLL